MKSEKLNKIQNYFKESIINYNKIIDNNPKNIWAWNNKGVALYHLGKYVEAIKCYDTVLKIDTSNEVALNNKKVLRTTMKERNGGLFGLEEGSLYKARRDLQKHSLFKVMGIGGAGNNMVSWLYSHNIKGAELIALNTDKTHLDIINADRKIFLGRGVTKGLGCGGYPEKGAEAAQETLSEIKEVLKGSEIVFICAGMGGGTGTGGAPIVAQAAKDYGAIVISIVTMPFKIERSKIDKAEFGLQQLRQVSDTVIVIDNSRVVGIAGNLPIQQAFAVANELIATTIRGVVETISTPNLVNLDLADFKAIMESGGAATIGTGTSDSTNRVEEAVRSALSHPMLDVSYKDAKGALINIIGGPDMTLDEVHDVGALITETLDPDANVIWGARVDENMKGKMTVTAIITGVKSPWILGKVDYHEPDIQTGDFNIEVKSNKKSK